ncbi:hypothetical protein AQUCO_00200067v1 [Aquilegia coerulea]|uniref:tRNA dimethylallyltransferase n=1 Tax=Aquilegia coerulea TaxID=218851 RepID=A0A2G5F1E7_AQUCA|nr:hypothetical protein AQUCO_00200067v1 [Aquilegia coerulea]
MLVLQSIHSPPTYSHMNNIATLGTMVFRLVSFNTLVPRRMLTTCCASTTKKSKKEKVIVISGPTGAGKSRLALELAKKLNGEIISADSVQVYQGLDIGSAKPSLNDRKEVPHHLVDILHPCEDYSVGRFFNDGRKATRDIIENGCVPIVAGGTGLYLRWYIYGKPEVPKASPEIASEVRSEIFDFQRRGDWDGAVQLVVKAGDPKAQYLTFNDWYRLKRSLEIIKSSGSPPSAFQVPYDSFRNPSDSGVEGLLSEASQLLDLSLLPNSNSASRAIGYRQAMEYLLYCQQQGGRSSAGEFFEFLSRFQQASRNFAKRQLTWFRNENIYQWIDASQPLDKVLNFIYDAYHDKSGNLVVPESLQMKKDLSSRSEISGLKAYRTKNRHLVRREDCADILNWIRMTQTQHNLVH